MPSPDSPTALTQRPAAGGQPSRTGAQTPSSESSESVQNKYKKAQGAVSFAQVTRKLNTKEDRFYMHKILGSLSLASFLYRYFYVLPRTGTLGFDELNFLNVGTMVVHTLLSSSAIIFKVPLKKIFKQPTMIWEEYRLHAIGFTWRCTLVYCLAAATQASGGVTVTPLLAHGSAGTPNAWAMPEVELLNLSDFSGSRGSEAFSNYADLPAVLAHTWAWRGAALKEQLLRFLVAISMHVVADLITLRFGDAGITTVRGDEQRPPRHAWLRKLTLFYGSYQFLALGSHLVPHAGGRGMDLAYNTLIAIQSSAFCMTLNRKGLIHYTTHAYIYGICLLVSGGYILWAMRSWGFFLAVLAAGFARTQFRASKYLIWATFALGFGLGAPHGAALGAMAFVNAGLWAALWKRHGIFGPAVEREAGPGTSKAERGQAVGDDAAAYRGLVEEKVEKLQ